MENLICLCYVYGLSYERSKNADSHKKHKLSLSQILISEENVNIENVSTKMMRNCLFFFLIAESKLKHRLTIK